MCTDLCFWYRGYRSEKIEKNLTSFLDKAKSTLETLFGISQQKQQELTQQQKKSGGSGVSSIVKAIMSSASGFLVNTLLVWFTFFFSFISEGILKILF